MNQDERLTRHSIRTGTPEPSQTIGDLCLRITFCDEYDFCEDCPIRKMINRLCEYEDTGLSPKEIVELKEKKNTVAKVQRCMYDSKHNTTLLTTKVTRDGVFIRGAFYYSSILLFKCLDMVVEILIYEHLHRAEVYYKKELIDVFRLVPGTLAVREDAIKREAVARAIKYAKGIKS